MSNSFFNELKESAEQALEIHKNKIEETNYMLKQCGYDPKGGKVQIKIIDDIRQVKMNNGLWVILPDNELKALEEYM